MGISALSLSPHATALENAAALQRLAMQPHHSAWVSASAGSGKTFVLIHRVITLLLQGASPDSILCLTYTKAAAAEMQERIFARLRGWLTLDDAALRRDIQSFTDIAVDLAKARRLFAELLEHPIGLKIQTIHAFCQALLGQFPLEAGLQPNFKILEDSSAQELRMMALKATYATALEGDASLQHAFTLLADASADKTITDSLISLLSDATKIDACFTHFPSVAVYTAALNTLLENEHSLTQQAYLEAVANPPFAEEIARIAGNVAQNEKSSRDSAFSRIVDWLSLPLEERVTAGISDYCSHFLTTTHTIKVDIVTKKNAYITPAERDILQQESERLLTLKMQRDKSCVVEQSTAMYQVLSYVYQQYTRLKNNHGLYDYADLIACALSLVTNSEDAPWVLYKLDQRLAHLLLDEAQDTSLSQWEIVQQLTADFFAGESSEDKDSSLFVVGDFKQSIYSFQGANPLLFQENEHLYTELAESAAKGWERVPLDVSFRSNQTVLDFVDSVFANDTPRHALGITDTLKHTAKRVQQAGTVALWPLAVGMRTPLEPRSLPLSRVPQTEADDVLATEIAARVKGWLDEGRILHARGRAVQPRDILLLVRKRSRMPHRLIKAFEKAAIPIAGADKFSLKDHLAVQDLLALGNFLLLPDDAYSLACVLKSPLFNVTEEQLFALCYNRNGGLWQRVQEHPDFRHVVEILKQWLGRVDFISPAALYNTVLLNARQHFRARFGEEVNDVLAEFENVLLNFEEQHIPTLQGFLHWADNAPLTIKRELGAHSANEVRIMTTHGAKGLQAPIVILADCNSTQTPKDSLLWANTLFVSLKGVDLLPETIQALKEHQDATAKAESYRLLYVALTRAEDELYLAGSAKNTKDPVAKESWYALAHDVFSTDSRTQTARDGTMMWHTPATAAGDRIEESPPVVAVDNALPLWCSTPVAPEKTRAAFATPDATDKSVAVGLTRAQAESAKTRGIILHSLLQKLPLVPPQQREAYLAGLVTPDDVALLQGLLNTPELHPVFATGRLTEVPLCGVFNNALYKGRLDCVIISDDTVLIIDYKSASTPPLVLADVPKSYVQQVGLYARGLRALYPNHRIEGGLLWTANKSLMMLPEKTLFPATP